MQPHAEASFLTQGSTSASSGLGTNLVSLDQIFQWPIFQDEGIYFPPNSLLKADQGLLGVDGSSVRSPTSSRSRRPQIDEDEILGLVQRFVRLVHIKNPVLDTKALLDGAKSVAELGLQWDASTCLVVSLDNGLETTRPLRPSLDVIGTNMRGQLVAAALGAIAGPFDSTPWSRERLREAALSSRQSDNLSRAENYYQSACRRFGLLDRSLTACHCYLISGIYLLYTLRPIQALKSFFEASTVFMVYLRSHGGSQPFDDASAPDPDIAGPLAQRLYWSCVKSERQAQHPTAVYSLILTLCYQ